MADEIERKERDELRDALADMLRIIEAMRMSTGLGRGQMARVEKARAALLRAHPQTEQQEGR